MSKPEYTHEAETHYTAKDVFYRLYAIIFSLLVIGFILKGYEQPEETRHVPSIFDYRGEIESLTIHKQNQHCRHEE